VVGGDSNLSPKASSLLFREPETKIIPMSGFEKPRNGADAVSMRVGTVWFTFLGSLIATIVISFLARSLVIDVRLVTPGPAAAEKPEATASAR